LRVYPYSNEHVFEEEIYKPWQNRQGPDPRGFLRLKTLVRAITISRTKAVIRLPSRIDELHHLDFADEERLEYEAAKLRSRTRFQEAVASLNCRKSFNALWLLNTLRMVCNHGLLAQSDPPSKLKPNALALFGYEGLGNTMSEGLGAFPCCLNCGLDLAESILAGWPPTNVPNSEKQSSADGLCAQCKFDAGYNNELAATTLPSVSAPYGSNTPQSSGPATPSEDVEMQTESSYTPTKIRALVDNLSLHYENHKWYVCLF
jgi:hypothetical protein